MSKSRNLRLNSATEATFTSHLILIIFSLCCFLPLLLIVGISLTGEKEIYTTGYKFIPEAIDLQAYDYILKNPKIILRAYGVTISTTLLGTAFGLMITAMLGYAMARKDFFLCRAVSFYVFFAMIFSGGLVPWYIICTRILHLKNKYIAMVVPYLVIPWFVLLMKGFFNSVPRELIESAKLDGCGDIGAFFRVVMPISKPAMTTVGLFIALHYWNDYKLAMYFIQDSKMYTLQYMLQQMMSNLNFMRSSMASQYGISIAQNLPSESARMAMCILAAGPMLVIFPFFQKHFVKGITVGAVKG